MLKRSSKSTPFTVNEQTPSIAEQDTGQISAQSPSKKKNPAAVALGRLGGKKGGKARAASLGPKRRSEIAQQAARSRWARKERGKP
jgi:hypothetical protein